MVQLRFDRFSLIYLNKRNRLFCTSSFRYSNVAISKFEKDHYLPYKKLVENIALVKKK